MAFGFATRIIPRRRGIRWLVGFPWLPTDCCFASMKKWRSKENHEEVTPRSLPHVRWSKIYSKSADLLERRASGNSHDNQPRSTIPHRPHRSPIVDPDPGSTILPDPRSWSRSSILDSGRSPILDPGADPRSPILDSLGYGHPLSTLNRFETGK